MLLNVEKLKLLSFLILFKQIYFYYKNAMEEVSSFSKELYEFSANGEWRKALKLGEIISLEERKRYLWVWPIEQHIKEFKKELDQLGVRSLCSLGCGTGLLEWFIMKCTALPIKGIEVDEFYW